MLWPFQVYSIFATLLPLPLVIVDPEASNITLALAIIIPGSIQMIIGNMIEPKLLGDSLELHPITVLLSLVFWGMLWGIPGMLLAAPITAVLKILFENLEITSPFAKLLAGKLPQEKDNTIIDCEVVEEERSSETSEESTFAEPEN